MKRNSPHSHHSSKVESSQYGADDITFAALTKAHYLPLIEHGNLPTAGTGYTESVRAGYRRGRFINIYQKTEEILSSGDRFNQIFQGHDCTIIKTQDYKVFFAGNSLAYGFGVPHESRYYKILQRKYSHLYQAIPASMSALNSTQENILLHLAIIPRRPNLLFIINGWNDVMMPLIFCTRPGDPMTISSLYSRQFELFFNLVLAVARRFRFASRFISKLIQNDRRDFLKSFFADEHFRKTLTKSILNVYMSNMQTMIESCALRGIEVVHVLQPCSEEAWDYHKDSMSQLEARDFQDQMSKYSWTKLNLSSHLNNMYQQIRIEISKAIWAKNSVSLVPKFHPRHFLDPVHLNSEGHKVLADELHKIIEAKIKLSQHKRSA